MEPARLQIIEPSGARRSQPIGSRPLIIGRDPECDVVIGYEQASRHHAQIGFDGYRYTITDLGSTNGTFLDDDLIPPHTAIEWPTNLPVRIGNIILRLQFSKTKAQIEAPASSRSAAPSASAAGSASQYAPTSGDNKTVIIVLVVMALLGLTCGCLGLASAIYTLILS
jgi:pSer/pThr/pTyr-binding forkhead associated (FHA) protein